MGKKITTAAIATTAALALAGCGGGGDGVDWDKYDASVKQRIDALERSSDCAGLQAEFDTADGHNSVDLMTYINKVMDGVGCYG